MTEEGASGVAGLEGLGQEVASEGLADEIEETGEEEVVARDPEIARRLIRRTKAMVLARELHRAESRLVRPLSCRQGSVASAQGLSESE